MSILDFILLGLVAVLWYRLSRQAASIQHLEIHVARLSAERRQAATTRDAGGEEDAVAAAPASEPTTVPAETGVPASVPVPAPEPMRAPAPDVFAVPPRLPAGARPAGAGDFAEGVGAREAVGGPGLPGHRGWIDRLPRINWEQFLGVKLFAWLGGLALFLAAAFFLKYSFDHDLVPPALRVALGYAAAMGLVGGGLRLWRQRYETLAATLVGTGVVILYAVTFACHAHYRFPFFGVVPTFLLMVLVTVAAFLLAVRMDARVIAVLGLLGGFLTPVLIQTGEDNPGGLFSYITILNLGLFAVVAHRRWTRIALLAALATVMVQAGWIGRFYTAEKLVVLQVVQPLFAALFAGFYIGMERRGRGDVWVTAAMVVPAAFALFHGLGLAASGAGYQPVRLFVLWLAVDGAILAAALSVGRPRWLEPMTGFLVFLVLATWTSTHADEGSLYPAIAAYFAFALLHTAAPLIRLRWHPGARPGLESQLFPALALALFALPILRDTGVLPGVFWMGMLGIVVLALGVAALAGAFLAAGAVLVVALVVVGEALVRRGPLGMDWGDGLLVVVGFAIVFVAGGWWLSRRPTPMGLGLPEACRLPKLADNPQLVISGAGAVLPFLLVNLLVSRATEANLHSLFGITALLVVIVLGLARATGVQALAALGLVGAGLVEAAWHLRGFGATSLGPSTAWYLLFYAIFTAYPFLVDRADPRRRTVWITAAAAAPVHFALVYLSARQAGPMALPGLIPAAFAVPTLGVLAWLARRWPVEDTRRLGVLSVQGGVALLFITLIFPIQFSREWLTVGWALEGAALLWLFRRLPHPGLRWVGLGLLAVAFVRLTLNPSVLDYHPRTGVRIWNWYLFAYLVASAAQFAGAWFLRPPDHRVGKTDARAVLRAFGVILLFVLMNLEIADYFAEGDTLTFDFRGNFARDLSYTIGWGLFALGLLVGGIVTSTRPTRYAGIGLLTVTLLKLFLHDLARLDQLYRIGAFAGVAVIAILASFLYQRFLNRREATHE